MTTFRGFDVLDLAQPNRLGALEDVLARKLVALDFDTGAVAVTAQGLVPKTARPFIWTAFSRAEAKVMSDFLDARYGRSVPFWMPSYQQDLTLASALSASGTTATVDWAGYTEYLFAQGKGRRHIGLWTSGVGFEYHQVTGAAHTPGAATEALTISPGATLSFPVGTVICFLRLCRLDSDEVQRSWYGPQVCEARIAVRELPLEEPV